MALPRLKVLEQALAHQVEILLVGLAVVRQRGPTSNNQVLITRVCRRDEAGQELRYPGSRVRRCQVPKQGLEVVNRMEMEKRLEVRLGGEGEFAELRGVTVT